MRKATNSFFMLIALMCFSAAVQAQPFGQLIYVGAKSADILATALPAWIIWSSSPNPYMATNIAPVVDRQLFEVFTTSLSDNASRGQLSINQANLAAWSAARMPRWRSC